LYLYVYKKQGDERRYDARPLAKNSKLFTFNNQVYDNLFWSCASGVTVWSAYEVLMMWSLANGYAPALDWPGDFLWLLLLIFLVPIWETFYFYLIHRMLHWPPLYRKVHYLHHRNTNVGPWSGLSMHPVEHIIYLGSVLIHWIVPSNPFLTCGFRRHCSRWQEAAATGHLSSSDASSVFRMQLWRPGNSLG
jgi:sterol desaturase/sphingolipid hydroxylase (fatty acid hydroxylase superfamily)